MSYILDALKKADAQRERDPARGIHARPAAVPGAAGAGSGGRPWVWAVSAAIVVALLGAGWYALEDRSADRPPMPAAGLAGAPPPVAAAPVQRSAAVTALAPAQTLPQVAPEPPVAAAVLPPPAAPRIEPADEEAQPSRAERRARARAAAVPAPGAAPAPPAPAAVPAAAPQAVNQPPAAAPAPAMTAQAPTLSGGLPPDAPKLAISGGVYSANAAQRMLIVNGQVVNEGADLGSGAVLEEIRPKAAVVRFRGARYTVGF